MTSLGLSNEPLYKEFWKWEVGFPTENKNGRFLLFFLFFWYFSPFFKYQSKTTITRPEMVFKDESHNKQTSTANFWRKNYLISNPLSQIFFGTQLSSF